MKTEKKLVGVMKKAVLFMAAGILLELLVFNFRALSFGASNQHPQFFQEGDTVYVSGMSGEPGFIYVDVDCPGEDGGQVPVMMLLSVQDEGSDAFYDLPWVTVYPPVEKSKYLSVHSYGAVKGLRISLMALGEASVQVRDVVYDAKVPWFVSVPRILAVFAVLCLAWGLRPGSGIYGWQGKVWQRRLAVWLLVLGNSAFFLFLVRSNPAFLDPVWPYHEQYHQLAVSLSQGKVSVDVGSEEMLAVLGQMENPYDYGLRMAMVPDAGSVWDTCYYEGKFYVYFGIVPVILFYLPYYLVFHGAFPTWLGVFLMGTGILGGVYYLFAQIRRRWFPDLPYVWYLMLSLIGGNCLNLAAAMLHADFYCLPILTALCLTLWGLGLVFSAVCVWGRGKGHLGVRLATGGLCLALTAGCRPQFLVGSFLLVPVLGPLIRKDWKAGRKVSRVLALGIPYVLVAAGIMYYNGIRFGSVFDFGANYNLTTNDMTRRGMNLDRLPDGILMYLFQPVSVKLNFPFAEVTAFYSEYLGGMVRDWTYGGAFWTRPILLASVCLAGVKKELREKGLFGFTVLGMVMALVVVAADTEMAGILNRYFTDFLWLLMIPAAVVLFQMLEKCGGKACCRWIVYFVLIAGAWGMFYELAMAFRGSGIMNDNAHRYYLIRALFQ